MLIGMVAGEASGDFLGAGLMSAILKRWPTARFAGIGGPKMQALGFESWFPMERLAVRGYVEVLRHYPGLLAMRSQLGSKLIAERPNLFVGVDAPDFNLDLEARLKSTGIPTVHYVSPSVWAWRGGRIKRMARAVNKVLALFPFEPALYEQAGVSASYVGHPLADAIEPGDLTSWGREQLRLPRDQKIYALLPGSRQSELRYHAELFVHAAKRVWRSEKTAQFIVPLVSRETKVIFEEARYAAGGDDLPIKLLFGHAREALAAADAVLVASGTATLETALMRKPMVITYRMAPRTWSLMKRMRYQPWVGLPNIIAGRFVVPEILQDEATPENLSQALHNIGNDSIIRERLFSLFSDMHQRLRQNASERAADALTPWLAPQ